MLERGMQADDRHVVRLERLVDAPRLRDGDRDRVRAQHLERDQHHHASAQRREVKRTIRVEPGCTASSGACESSCRHSSYLGSRALRFRSIRRKCIGWPRVKT